MALFDIDIQGQTFEIEAENESQLPEIVSTITQQQGFQTPSQPGPPEIGALTPEATPGGLQAVSEFREREELPSLTPSGLSKTDVMVQNIKRKNPRATAFLEATLPGAREFLNEASFGFLDQLETKLTGKTSTIEPRPGERKEFDIGLGLTPSPLNIDLPASKTEVIRDAGKLAGLIKGPFALAQKGLKFLKPGAIKTGLEFGTTGFLQAPEKLQEFLDLKARSVRFGVDLVLGTVFGKLLGAGKTGKKILQQPEFANEIIETVKAVDKGGKQAFGKAINDLQTQVPGLRITIKNTIEKAKDLAIKNPEVKRLINRVPRLKELVDAARKVPFPKDASNVIGFPGVEQAAEKFAKPRVKTSLTLTEAQEFKNSVTSQLKAPAKAGGGRPLTPDERSLVDIVENISNDMTKGIDKFGTDANLELFEITKANYAKMRSNIKLLKSFTTEGQTIPFLKGQNFIEPVKLKAIKETFPPELIARMGGVRQFDAFMKVFPTILKFGLGGAAAAAGFSTASRFFGGGSRGSQEGAFE